MDVRLFRSGKIPVFNVQKRLFLCDNGDEKIHECIVSGLNIVFESALYSPIVGIVSKKFETMWTIFAETEKSLSKENARADSFIIRT